MLSRDEIEFALHQFPRLSAQEIRIAYAYAWECERRDNIASDFCLSPRTVYTYINNIYAKLGFRGRGDGFQHASALTRVISEVEHRGGLNQCYSAKLS